MTMAMELIRHIAGLYSGKAFKGDLTQIYITGNEIWMAQQILASQQAEGAQGERVVQTAPERIYLIVGADCPRDADFSELAEVTWCEDDLDDGIEYVRADKARADLAQPSTKFCACVKCDDAYSCSIDGCQFKPVQAQPSPAPELKCPKVIGYACLDDIQWGGDITLRPEKSEHYSVPFAPVAQSGQVPYATAQDKALGWTLDYRFVERVTDLAGRRTEYSVSMEATEQVLLAARELLAAAPAQGGE